MDGAWCIEHESVLHTQLTVEWRTGWASYYPELELGGGAFSITRDSETIRFDFDCSRSDVLCPTDIWPTVIELDDPYGDAPSLPRYVCDGNLLEPGECGSGTPNFFCESVCDGKVRVDQGGYEGHVYDDGFLMGLSSELVANTTDVCSLITLSSARADLVTTGHPAELDWYAEEMRDGILELVYPAGCLLASDQTISWASRERIIGRPITFWTRFEGVRCDAE